MTTTPQTRRVTGGTLPAAGVRHDKMLAATSKLPVEPLAKRSAPKLPSALDTLVSSVTNGTPPRRRAPAATSPLDGLLRGLGLADGAPVPPPPGGRLPGPAVTNTR